MIKAVKVPGIPTVGTDYRNPSQTQLMSIGDEALITIADADGQVTIHPEALAFGDSENGWLVVPGWRGMMAYERGSCTASMDGWAVCVGDVICSAITEGRIPLYPVEALPDSHKASIGL
ncbi:hypothetical protein SAMN04488581_2584 [Mycolicibacterium neoaurum]|uniref:hypothetical protein n=1 Tax=Mycolicibacterium neoaurum TaxID=1795 RepID=UPI00056D06DE|nr:hypothetical protein [Mycolicibacterium neoaurum]SDD57905.1 hypothetical protein SAMN04488581_2584 [Mycolicibacterium neoaurum]